MKKIVLGLVAAASILIFLTQNVWAGEIDLLLNKLVEKGVLTQSEAAIIKDETKQQVAKEVAEQRSYAVPTWVQKLKVTGDMRIRFQNEKRQNTSEYRNRGRIRYRLGIQSNIVKNVTVGAGFATGGADPRSTNQTFQDSFQHPDLRLDYAYAEWAPNANFKTAAGKFKFPDYLWTPDDMLWDTDINPEGWSAHYEQDLGKDVVGFLNTGVWVADENNPGNTADKSDPFLVYGQGGIRWNNQAYVTAIEELYPNVIDVTLAGTYYGWNGLKGLGPDWCGASNTGLTAVNSTTGACTGTLIYDYDSLGASAEVGISNPFGQVLVERAAVFGDYIHNFDPDTKRNGWAFGAKFGHKKLDDRGKWLAKYQYTVLGQDAFVDFTPDSDRLGGATNLMGHEIEVQYSLLRNVIFGIDFYHDSNYRGTKNTNSLVQADLNFKF